MKLFVYHNAGYEPQDIHAILDFINDSLTLCLEKRGSLSYFESYDKKDYLDTTRPFCKECEKLLKDDYNINMKQLAINQKLGVK